MWKTYIAGREKPLTGFEPLGHRWVNFSQSGKTVVERTTTGYKVASESGNQTTLVASIGMAKAIAEGGWETGEA